VKLAANLTLLYPELPFIERFQAASNDGFKIVEIQFPYDTPAADIKQALDRHNLTCVLINVPAGDLMTGGLGLACVSGKQAEFEQALELCASYVKVLSPSRVNVLAGRSAGDRKTELDILHTNLIKAADVLAPLGVTVTFEAVNTINMPGFLIATFNDMKQVMDHLQDDRIRMQFDIYHMAMMKEPIAQLLTEHMTSIGHIQFADMPGRHEPGSGDIDFSEVFRLIQLSDYLGCVAAEYHPAGDSTSAGLGWRFDLKSWAEELG
jgi:hydroxypyruvate isomerase